ncbi:MAG: aldehyde-activating protein [Cereibacter sphaeroides]|uniref:Aldehyde-activating protein n=1 Tax=Cereibacter sphaeroides TaxID=1063 RepID=A0A2W5S369_CERSP|nr:MAG: aldehyde-activating protein [Cereibacter sphaeroides]
MTEARTGHCLCGAVKVTVSDPSHELGICHCSMCRRWSGSSPSLTVPEGALAVEGASHVKSYVSSDWAERTFCDTCGSALWYRLTGEGAPRDYYMASGLLDDLSGMKVGHEIFVDCQPQAFVTDGTADRKTEAEFFAAYSGEGGDAAP